MRRQTILFSARQRGLKTWPPRRGRPKRTRKKSAFRATTLEGVSAIGSPKKIQPLRLRDNGIYRCQIDFALLHAQTGRLMPRRNFLEQDLGREAFFPGV